jgi:uracil-DNA glycosylase
MTLFDEVPEDWRVALALTPDHPMLLKLDAFLAHARAAEDIYPAAGDVFAALRLTPYRLVRAVIVGQDPYREPGQADGLAFSVRPGVPLPSSLRTMLDALDPDRTRGVPNGSLVPWARRGVLLLNTVLTVRRGSPGSHAGRGWESISTAIVAAVAKQDGPIVFFLWGARARTLRPLIDKSRHIVIESGHPSQPQAWRDFADRSPFGRANDELVRRGEPPIDWDLGT